MPRWAAFPGTGPLGPIEGLVKRQAKGYLKSVRLAQAPPKDSDGWEWVHKHLDHATRTRELVSRWNAYMEGLLAGPALEDARADALPLMAAGARQAKSVLDFSEKEYPFLCRHLSDLFMGAAGQPGRLDSPESLDCYIKALELYIEKGRLASAQQRRDKLRTTLARHDNLLCQRMLRLAVEDLAGPATDRDGLLAEWQKCCQELERQHDLLPAFAELRDLASRIEKAGAANWAKELLTEPATRELDPLLPVSWRAGLEWHRLMNYLDSIDSQHRLRHLADELRREEKRLAKATERLVENLTWLRMTAISERHRRSLQRYAQAIERIGAGTGRVRTPRYRREAREAMVEAVEAVPCWIMPHWRVSETLPAEIGKFDLVIVDEASQSDIWALPALLRGKKILVVGDNKQVSPTVIGPAEAQLTNLAHQYLAGFALGTQMRPEYSIYDLAKVAFAGNNICLREHFRCVAPIIAFSDRHWYTPSGQNNFLIPLRVPTASERIDPPLVDVLVKDGYRKADKTNPPEAHAIVGEIKALVHNPLFSGRSIGVISLLGQGAQSKLIADLLFRELGEEKIREHDIYCGDPPSFQGNEKDIIFLSLVDDASQVGTNTSYFGSTVAAQRFNVAASRAKDRMYLFRSFRREDINNANDLRGKLLDHFLNPTPEENRSATNLRELLESDFEERVYDALVARGYRVIPQVPAGGFRIDMVVEGSNNRRLAVECDGVAYHGPERYFDDLNRQRGLERMGWTFWRCWGADFYRDPDGVLDELYDFLDKMGIVPIRAQSATLSPLVEYREVCGLITDQDEVEDQAEAVVGIKEIFTEERGSESDFEDAEAALPTGADRQQPHGLDGDITITRFYPPEPTRLRSARKTLGKSQESLAQDLGVTHATYNRWERGHSLPAPDRREKLWRLIERAERQQDEE